MGESRAKNYGVAPPLEGLLEQTASLVCLGRLVIERRLVN